MNNQAIPEYLLDAASPLLCATAEQLFEDNISIVSAAIDKRMKSTTGLSFCSISKNILSQRSQDVLTQAEDQLGLPFEVELMKVTGFVPPHFHLRCSCAIVRCATEPAANPLGQFAQIDTLVEFRAISIGEVISIPAGMVHAMRVDHPVHFISINFPAFDETDTFSFPQ